MVCTHCFLGIFHILKYLPKPNSINMDTLTTTGSRILYALPIAVFGLFHFMNAQAMGAMVPSFIPGGVFWVYLTGLALLSAAISILIQKKARLACLLLALMLIIFALTIHLPSVMGGNESSMAMLLKDTALAGGALGFAGTAKG